MFKKIKFISQSEISDCGLACVCMLANYHGYGCNLSHLKEYVASAGKGESGSDLVNVGKRIGLEVRGYKVKVDGLPLLLKDGPIIVYLSKSHFSVLERINNNIFYIYNPAVGVEKLSVDEFLDIYSGIAFGCSKGKEFKFRKYSEVREFVRFLDDRNVVYRGLFYIFLISMLLQFFLIVPPKLFGVVIDSASEGTLDGYSLFLIILLFMVFEVLFVFLRGLSVIVLSRKILISLNVRLFGKMMRLPYLFFYKRRVGDVAIKFESLQYIQTVITGALVSSFVDVLLILSSCILMILISPYLFFISVVFVVMYIVLRIPIHNMIRRITHEAISKKGGVETYFIETAQASQQIKIYGVEGARLEQYSMRYRDYKKSDDNLGMKILWGDVLARSSFGLQVLTVLLVSVVMIEGGDMTAGLLFAFFLYMKIFSDSFVRFLESLTRLGVSKNHIQRVMDIISHKSDSYIETKPRECDDIAINLGEGVSVENLSFSYDGKSCTISRFNYFFEKGKCTAISGKSGCGKSTLILCIMGLLPASLGHICIGNKRYSNLADAGVQFSAVMQGDQIIEGTIFENITFDKTGISENEVFRCAKIACIHDEILDLPMGYGTKLASGGHLLSGGQKQRIFIARALCSKPQVVFLDEATSEVDADTQLKIYENISNLDLTTIVIAHREEVLNIADKVVYLNNA